MVKEGDLTLFIEDLLSVRLCTRCFASWLRLVSEFCFQCRLSSPVAPFCPLSSRIRILLNMCIHLVIYLAVLILFVFSPCSVVKSKVLLTCCPQCSLNLPAAVTAACRSHHYPCHLCFWLPWVLRTCLPCSPCWALSPSCSVTLPILLAPCCLQVLLRSHGLLKGAHPQPWYMTFGFVTWTILPSSLGHSGLTSPHLSGLC